MEKIFDKIICIINGDHNLEEFLIVLNYNDAETTLEFVEMAKCVMQLIKLLL